MARKKNAEDIALLKRVDHGLRDDAFDGFDWQWPRREYIRGAWVYYRATEPHGKTRTNWPEHMCKHVDVYPYQNRHHIVSLWLLASFLHLNYLSQQLKLLSSFFRLIESLNWNIIFSFSFILIQTNVLKFGSGQCRPGQKRKKQPLNF